MKNRLLILCLACIGFLQIHAQNGQYDVQLTIIETDYTNLNMVVDIEVKATSAVTNFNISDQNYRISFDNTVLANPTILTELTLSGFVSTATPPTNSFYAPHTLTGTFDTLISYNVELSGGDGYPLNEVDWVPVGRLGFDIIDTLGCFDMHWNTKAPEDFPPTFIGEKAANVLLAADEGNYTDLYFCRGPQPQADLFTVLEDTPLSGNVLDNDLNLAQPNVSLSSPPANGTLNLNPDGTFTYTPDVNYLGMDSFLYQVCEDTPNICNEAVATIVVSTVVVAISMDAQPNCANNNGIATATGSGNATPFSYLWSDGTTTAINSDLPAGIHRVTVTDNVGATSTASIELVSTNNLVLNESVTDESCGLENGSISLSPSGEDGPYTYAWDNGATSPSLIDLAPGDYTVACSSNFGCTIAQTFTVAPFAGLSFTTVPSACNLSEGQATVLFTNGFDNPTYAWNNGQTTATATGLAQGWYSATVTDQTSGCSKHKNVYVDEDIICKSIISGNILNDDTNFDCVTDGTTESKTAQMVVLNQGGLFVEATYTDGTGYYEFIVDQGTYEVEAIYNFPEQALCPLSGKATINASTPNTTYNQDFYSEYLPNEDLRVQLYMGTARPGFFLTHTLYYYNDGGLNADGTVTYTHDPLLINPSSNPPADAYDPVTQTMQWNFSALPPSQRGIIRIYYTVPVSIPLGTLLTHSASVKPVIDDLTPNNNSLTTHQTVVGSFDPNDKMNFSGEEPFGGNIAPEVSPYAYQIRFQNTGTDTAFTVVIKDEIDANLDIYSLHPVDASHAYTMDLEGENTVVFSFENIMLPDSNVNEPASHGFIRFTIEPKPNLALGTVISNEAGIYFDFNAPVITNLVENTIAEPILPIELLRFEATYQTKRVWLEWETAIEINNARFDIERSTDGLNFNKIGEVAGAGMSTTSQRYNYIDEEAYHLEVSKLYYRLKQVDTEGQYGYSNIELVELPKRSTYFEVYPNPFTDELTVSLVQSSLEGKSIEILNSLGQIITKFQAFNPDQYLTKISLKNLPAGIYYIKIIDGTQSNLRRVTKAE